MHGVARKTSKKKTPELIKQKLLASLVEHLDGEGYYLELNEEIRNAKELQDAIDLVKKYEDLLKAANKKIIFW